MNRSGRRQGGGAVPCAVLLYSLLLLSALATGACQKAEGPSEEAPAAADGEATTEAETLDTTPTAAPTVPEEITIIGRMKPPRWEDQDVTIGPGDTILWTVGDGRHGVRFPFKADCDLALATMTFDPPLDPIAGGGCQSKTTNKAGDVIVSAKVNVALAGDLPYDCVVHEDEMPGTLKPK